MEIDAYRQLMEVNPHAVFYAIRRRKARRGRPPQAAALSYAGSGVRVNSIRPGYIDTPLLADLPNDVYDGLVSLHPMGRLGKSEEVTEPALFLLSDRAGFITGSQHLVDGGYTAR